MSQKSIKTIVIEAIIVGIILIPITYVAGVISKQIVNRPSLPEVCQTWNENYIMEINLFLAGFLFHILLEYIGVNKWYADNYNQTS